MKQSIKGLFDSFARFVDACDKSEIKGSGDEIEAFRKVHDAAQSLLDAALQKRSVKNVKGNTECPLSEPPQSGEIIGNA